MCPHRNMTADRDGRRGGVAGRLRGASRSLRDRMHRAPCRQAREPLRGPWSRSARAIRERFGGIGELEVASCGCEAASRPRARTTWPTIFNRRSRSSASKAFTSLRAGARRQRRRGALHPTRLIGESVRKGAELRDDRGAPPGLARVQADVQTSSGFLEKYARTEAHRPRW